MSKAVRGINLQEVSPSLWGTGKVAANEKFSCNNFSLEKNLLKKGKDTDSAYQKKIKKDQSPEKN